MDAHAILKNVFRERSIDLYKEATRIYDAEYDMGRLLIKHSIREYSGHDATIEEVCAGMFTMMHSSFRRVYGYIAALAGCSQLNVLDLAKLLKNTFFMIHGGFMMHKLHINGENFQLLPNNIQFTRRFVFWLCFQFTNQND
jgi:hypothetical protein